MQSPSFKTYQTSELQKLSFRIGEILEEDFVGDVQAGVAHGVAVLAGAAVGGSVAHPQRPQVHDLLLQRVEAVLAERVVVLAGVELVRAELLEDLLGGAAIGSPLVSGAAASQPIQGRVGSLQK